MEQPYKITCDNHGTHLVIGVRIAGNGVEYSHIFYEDEREMERLGTFLFEHEGCPLRFVNAAEPSVTSADGDVYH